MEVSASGLAGTVIEDAARHWLAAFRTLRPERIVAADVLRWGDRSYRPFFLELDAVIGVAEPEEIFEVKWTSNPKVALTALRQAHRALSILSHAWPGVRGGVLWVQADRGRRATDDALENAIDVDTEELHWPGRERRVTLFRLPYDLIAPYVETADRCLVSAARDESDGAVSARAERQRAREAGEEREHEGHPLPDNRPEEIVAYADEDEPESPFAALRNRFAERG
jgi:hypothetical protein